jgi:hypothetical protein
LARRSADGAFIVLFDTFVFPIVWDFADGFKTLSQQEILRRALRCGFPHQGIYNAAPLLTEVI